jgi:RimJ/RimL family protein N-acetyltransferase
MLPRSFRLQTPRLTLRPSDVADADRAFEIQSNWSITRNLRMARFPPDRADIAAWFARHAREWEAGTAYRFAILHDDRMVGLIDIDEIAHNEGDLGYWLDEPAWGKGFAFEAGQAIVRFAFEQIGLIALNSGHAADNPASGRVLAKLGFCYTGDTTVRSRTRGTDIVQRRYRLAAPPHRTAAAAG